MIKQKLLLLFFGFLSSLSYGQVLTCEKLAKQIEADTTKSIWDYDSIPADTYYCLGKYFALRDINKKIFLIQTYGNSEWANPCIVCRYNSYGFRFCYHYDIILDHVSKFIEGYNEVSKSYLKAKIGDSAFARIDDIPKVYFNPKEVLSNSISNGEFQKYLDVAIINDTTINVKIIVDSLFKDYPQFLTQVTYGITDYNYKNKNSGNTQVMNFKQIKEQCFVLTEKSNDKYYFKINFDFKALASEEKYCWCALMDEKEYNYVIPLKIK